MSKAKNVAIVSNTSWYIYNFRRSTILELKNKGYNPICIAPRDEYTDKLINELGVRFEEYKLDGKSLGALKELRALFELFCILKSLDLYFVFNFTIKINVYSGFCCKLLNLPYCNNVSGLGTTFLHKSKLFYIVKFIYGISNKMAEKVFFQNPDDMSLFIGAGLSNISNSALLPGSGINVNDYPYSDLSCDSQSFTFLMISRVIADKGVREYIDAAQVIKSNNSNVRFLLVGSWDVSNRSSFDAETINNWINEGVVEFLGHQSDVRRWIYDADVVVLPSYREGLPRTILEAGSCGRPAIVTNVPGCRHSIVPEVSGWLCEPRSSESLADRMRYCINLGKRGINIYGRNARKNIEDNFSDEIVINAYLALL